ncbi:MAG: DUF2950 domain-containing protein [Steroidobacteraceae bacterium]
MRRAHLLELTAVAVLLSGVPAGHVLAQQPGQRTFASPAAAASALFAAVRSSNEHAILDILGPDGKRIVSSGDATEDADNRATFVQRYDEMHRLTKEPDGTMTLYVGAANWPMPIPIVQAGRSWYFDTDAGKREILYRRVGRNEISAIRVCEALVAAEKEYFSTHEEEYARRIFSKGGAHNGLYWKAAAGEPQSPIGPLVASAVAEGYVRNHSGPTAYRGYYFHVLTAQAASAPGGARSYLVDDKMTGGFAFVAYPAEYRSSGVMTFIVGADGVVYEKDLGRQTARLARALKAYNPDPTWHRSEDEPQPTGQRAE